MKLTALGVSPAVQNPGGACSGYLLEEGNTHLLLDCGHGVVAFLQRAVDLRQLSAIIISHMHPDHYFDLVPLKYAFLFQEIPPIPLLLPPSGRALLERLRAAIGLSEGFFGESFQIAEYDPTGTCRDVDGYRIDFASTQHFVEGYAMRFTMPGSGERALFYSSDTAYTDWVRDLAQGATLGLIEATELEHETEDESPGHLTAQEAGTLAREAGIERLILTHYSHLVADQIVAQASAAFGGAVELAQEGKSYEL